MKAERIEAEIIRIDTDVLFDYINKRAEELPDGIMIYSNNYADFCTTKRLLIQNRCPNR